MQRIIFILGTLTILLLSLPATGQGSFSFGVKIFGKGKPMVFIPGLKGDGAATYATTIQHYENYYTCYVITLAGFAGQPASKRDSALLKGQRDELIEYIKQQHLQKPVLVGFSFGGVLALWMACKEPSLFSKIIDIDGVPFEDAIEQPNINIDSLRDTIAKDYKYIQAFTPRQMAHKDSVYNSPKNRQEGFEYLKKLLTDSSQIAEVMDWDKASDLKATWLMLCEMEELDLRREIANIKSPILVLGSWVGWDSLTTKEAVQAAYTKQFAKAKNCEIAFSAHGKHFLMWEDHDWFINQIDNFLSLKK